MAKPERINVTLPPGRLVFSNLYEPKTHDHLGNRLMYKNGEKAGQERDEYGGLIAIPKTRANWWEEVSADPAVGAWGQAIVNKANQDFPQGHAQSAAFSWKISDGDSQIPNSVGKKNCDNPLYKGHWLINVSNDKPIVLCNKDGSARLMEKDAIKPGYWVQVSINVCGNEQLMKPGLYIGANAIALNRMDEVIITGVNPASLGFGGSTATAGTDVPAGYGQAMPPSTAAVPNAVPAQTAQVPATPVAATPGTGVPAAGVPVATIPATQAVPGVAASGVATVPATPNAAFVQQAIAPTPAVPQAAAVPVPAATPQLIKTAKFPQGVEIQQFYDAGWTDDKMIADGYLIRV